MYPLWLPFAALLYFPHDLCCAASQKKTRWMLRQGLQVLRCLFRILCCPCRYILLVEVAELKARHTHDLVMNVLEAMESRAMDTHDLELTQAFGHERYIQHHFRMRSLSWLIGVAQVDSALVRLTLSVNNWVKSYLYLQMKGKGLISNPSRPWG
jgi:hypothetical protein